MCNKQGALKVDYQNLGFTELSIDKNISIHIYRIVQELLNNILKHAKATRAVVQVVYDRGHFSITVEDDGEGFNTANFNQPPQHNGMGWLNVQNRVTSLEGKDGCALVAGKRNFHIY
jgi:signal transduction histidine kinase